MSSTLLPSYAVYIDESFFQFWGLNRPTDNFIYLAFGIPVDNLKAFEFAYKSLLAEFQNAVRADLGSNAPAELKSSTFRKLCIDSRRRMALKLRNVMSALNCFFLAEYSEVQGFLLEEIRSDLIESGARELPLDWKPLYEAKRNKVIADIQAKQLGQSPLLERLIALPSAALGHYLAFRAEHYEVCLDPRGKAEDAQIASAISDLIDGVSIVLKQNEHPNLTKVITDVKSEQSPGLQIADLLAAEVRWWFVSNPGYLEYGSGRTLLHKNELTAKFSGKTSSSPIVKPERHIRLPLGLASRARNATPHSLFPYFRNSLANGLISCVARFGEFRHIDLKHNWIIDSPDNRAY
jgi:hypothetical protein